MGEPPHPHGGGKELDGEDVRCEWDRGVSWVVPLCVSSILPSPARKSSPTLPELLASPAYKGWRAISSIIDGVSLRSINDRASTRGSETLTAATSTSHLAHSSWATFRRVSTDTKGETSSYPVHRRKPVWVRGQMRVVNIVSRRAD